MLQLFLPIHTQESSFCLFCGQCVSRPRFPKMSEAGRGFRNEPKKTAKRRALQGSFGKDIPRTSGGHCLSGPISREIAIVSLRYPLSRDTFSAIPAIPQQGAIPPPWCLLLHRHMSAIPHFTTYRAMPVRYPRKTSTKMLCNTIAESIARFEKYCCWAS